MLDYKNSIMNFDLNQKQYVYNSESQFILITKREIFKNSKYYPFKICNGNLICICKCFYCNCMDFLQE